MSTIEQKSTYEILAPTSENTDLIHGAVNLINYFAQQEQLMLPVTEAEITQLVGNQKLLVAVVSDTVVGSIGLTREYEGNLYELGAWAVDKDYQTLGVGRALLVALLLQLDTQKIIAFGNDNSGPIFEKLGAVISTDFARLPQSIFEPCLKCPRFPGEHQGCCDTIYDLAPLAQKVQDTGNL